VLGNGAEGELRAPAEIVKNYPAVFVVRVYGLNANGKVYEADKVFQLAK
jgi:hypothetical protein